MKKVLLSLTILLAISAITIAQSVGIGTTTPDASAVLELSTTAKGFLPPRMTAAQKALIPLPKAGLIIYQTDGTKGLYIYNGSAWEAATGAGAAVNAWSINGNAGTLPASNFIGTTDNQPLKFRVNNLPSGELNAGTANTAFGPYALTGNITGFQNTAIGYNSLNKNISGSDNAAIGIATLYLNVSGSKNTALGTSTLVLNESGNENVATGYYALYSNSTGNNNVASGAGALYSNSSGYSNTAMGKRTLYYNTTQSNLVAIGDSALLNNGKNSTAASHAIGNTAVGSKSLYANTTGSANTAQGYQSLYENTIGFQNTAIGLNSLNKNISGNDNTAIGVAALYANLSGNYNIAVGTSALVLNNSGNYNVATGYYALNLNVTGSRNVGVGNHALATNSSGSFNTALGEGADVNFSNINNATAIGYNATVDNANSMVFGNANVIAWAFGRTSVAGGNALQVGNSASNGNGARLTVGGVWTNASDSAKKDGITMLDGADILSKLKQLPVTRWKYKGTNEYHIGPMAQDFYKIFNVGVDDTSISSIDPAGIALKAIQAQQQEIDLLKEQNKTMMEQMKKMQAAIETLQQKK